MEKASEQLAQFLLREPGVALLWGATDTGKTTLALELANYCHRRGRSVAVVDADVGQSDLGPPGTVGLGFLSAPAPDMASLAPTALFFVGAKSPRGLELQCATACRRLVDLAFWRGAQVVIVDTTGLVSGIAGRTLKASKFELLGPEHLVLLERRRELHHLWKPLAGRRTTRLWRLRPHPRVQTKDKAERQDRRSRRLARHWQNATAANYDLSRVTLRQTVLGTGRSLSPAQERISRGLLGPNLLHAENLPEGTLLVLAQEISTPTRDELRRSLERPLWLLPQARLHRLLVGLHDGWGNCLGVGLLLGIDWNRGHLQVLADPDLKQRATEIWLGYWQLDQDEFTQAVPARLLSQHGDP